MQGSSKAVQRAKFLVTQALNTPSTIGQTMPTTSAATTSNAMSSSDRTETNSSPAPVRGNFAAIPSSSSEWPTIEQANNMAVQAPPPAKPVASNKSEKANDDMKSSPELSDGSQEVFEENVASVVNKSEDVVVNSVDVTKSLVTSSPVTSDTTQTASSAWNPFRQLPQSMGACTSAVTTTGSSSVTVVSSRVTENKVTYARNSSSSDTAPHKPLGSQGSQGAQVQFQSRSNRTSESTGVTRSSPQENWESKVLCDNCQTFFTS